MAVDQHSALIRLHLAATHEQLCDRRAALHVHFMAKFGRSPGEQSSAFADPCCWRQTIVRGAAKLLLGAKFRVSESRVNGTREAKPFGWPADDARQVGA